MGKVQSPGSNAGAVTVERKRLRRPRIRRARLCLPRMGACPACRQRIVATVPALGDMGLSAHVIVGRKADNGFHGPLGTPNRRLRSEAAQK